MTKRLIKQGYICLFLLITTFTISATQKALAPAGCISATGKAVCDNTKYCNCTISNSGDAICTNDNCIAARSTSGHALCEGPSCIAAMVTDDTAECKSASCRLVATTQGKRVCSGGKCDCVNAFTSFKEECITQLDAIRLFLSD